MNKIYDYEVKKIHLWEKLLLFVKPSYICDKEGNIFVETKCKKMFGKVYTKKHSVKRGKEIK